MMATCRRLYYSCHSLVCLFIRKKVMGDLNIEYIANHNI